MKVGLYSVSCSGVWFNDRPALTVEEFVDTAKKFHYDRVELDLKRPHGSPLDLDAERCKQIRDYIGQSGLELSAVAANNNFASIIPELLENELLMVREQIRVAKMLGAPVIRLFAAWRGIVKRNGIATYEVPDQYFNTYGALTYELHQSIIACLQECVKYAEDAGVILALQNHHPIIETYQDMLDFVRAVDSPYLKCCLDAPCCGWNDVCQSDAYLTQAVKDVGDLQMLTHANAEFVETPAGIEMISFDPHIQPVLTNYPAFIKALKAQGFPGYINFEFCHMPFHGGKVYGYNDYIENQIRLAQLYFRGLVDNS